MADKNVKTNVNPFEAYVKIANDPKQSLLARNLAQKELRKIEYQTDTYNKKNNPAKYAAKLDKQAAYWKERAKAQKK
jgi:hypothetical protein